MNLIFGYTIPEAKKAAAALVVFALGIVGYFVAFDPSLTQAAPLLASAVVGVVGVFLAKNHTADDVQKAVQALLASGFAVASVYLTVDPNTVQTITTLVLAVVNVVVVHQAVNAPAVKRA